MKVTADVPLIFMHIPKCGGMSLFSSLAETFGPRIVDLYDDSPRSVGRFRLKIQDKSKLVYCGHFSFGLHNWIGRDASYISFVREPISRMISLYYYCLPTFKTKFSPSSGVSLKNMKSNLNYPDFFFDFEKSIAGDYSPEAFFSSKSAELDNGMVRRFSGKGLSAEPCKRSDLERAKQVIESAFSFVVSMNASIAAESASEAHSAKARRLSKAIARCAAASFHDDESDTAGSLSKADVKLLTSTNRDAHGPLFPPSSSDSTNSTVDGLPFLANRNSSSLAISSDKDVRMTPCARDAIRARVEVSHVSSKFVSAMACAAVMSPD